MHVIPVIDIRGGVAVAASRGDRARYRSLETPLAASADPVAVALGLRSLFPFSTLYVADLDGIEGRGADLATQQRVFDAWPGTELWIDDGTTDLRHRVIGSETLRSLVDYESARRSAGPSAPLSLDFRGDTFLGPPQLLDDATLWPDRVIVMTLARVGSGEGPDLTRLAAIVARAGNRQIYAAGGVRDVDDLKALRDIGVAGALIATALHSGKVTPGDLVTLA
ncbi:HisA/HisF-related TIM barrel protein [Hyphomicrobium sp. CS1GBMeth3]|uniref:HisA/HisF-related TIM barrel protein n=1 Tax=Hyphomicrobium sp. CS1GBMeth3 TaxID=1892845 RepID=UPI0009303CA3|nr:HisA/HisF-related TIM barrel protein [Hyphomicrobium sp. CS1GBMeth3]